VRYPAVVLGIVLFGAARTDGVAQATPRRAPALAPALAPAPHAGAGQRGHLPGCDSAVTRRGGPRAEASDPAAAVPDGLCTRLAMIVSPQSIPPGMTPQTGVLLQVPAINPGTGTVLVHVDIEGKPGRNVTVQLTVRSVPGSGGHRHLTGWSYPTAWLENTSVRTDTSGDAETVLHVGYRGGVELVEAQTTAGAPKMTATFQVEVRQPGLVDFFGPDGFPTTQPRAPYFPVGATAAHPQNHFVARDALNVVHDILLTFWQRQAMRHPELQAPRLRPLQLNDMSLSAGGRFRAEPSSAFANEQCAYAAPGRPVTQDYDLVSGHRSHDRGYDVDIATCFALPTANGGWRRVTDAECQTLARGSNGYMRVMALDEQGLSDIAAKYGAVVFAEGDHWHLRVPVAPYLNALRAR